MRILLTNDDGIRAVGVRAMHKALVKAGHEVVVAAPTTEQSAVGHAVTLSSPLRVKELVEVDFRGFAVSGTPVDCVKLALSRIMDVRPDFVVSGINAGANVGVDILYSGTVSAATEAALIGLPALAVSFDGFNPVDLSGQADYAAGLIPKIPLAELPRQCVLNLNFPARAIAETLPLVVCRHTRAAYEDFYDRRTDPRGRDYYWLDGLIPPGRLSPDSDRALLTKGHITLTPLKFDFTDHATLTQLHAKLGDRTA